MLPATSSSTCTSWRACKGQLVAAAKVGQPAVASHPTAGVIGGIVAWPGTGLPQHGALLLESPLHDRDGGSMLPLVGHRTAPRRSPPIESRQR